MLAFLAALVQMLVLFQLLLKVIHNSKSMQSSAFLAVLVQMLALLLHLPKSNSLSKRGCT